MTATCTAAEFRAWATIDLQALRDNLALARQAQPSAAVVAVVKANGYGHGLLAVTRALLPELRPQDCLGVATLEEGLALRQAGISAPVLLLEGTLTEAELMQAMGQGFMCVIHSLYQLRHLQNFLNDNPDVHTIVWLKLDTGMHRLGLNASDFEAAWRALQGQRGIGRVVVMSHLACADDPASPATERQLQFLVSTLTRIGIPPAEQEISLAASAGILSWPQTHFNWLRPGIMIYGGSPMIGESGPDRGLRPAMTLRSRLIAINEVVAGEAIGYGGTCIAAQDARLGIVSIGYGDGYPRKAPNGTPVVVRVHREERLVSQRCPLAGRVSMDMLIVDLSHCPEAMVGDEVVLWGEELPADEIARHCGTISYELFCQVTARVHYVYC